MKIIIPMAGRGSRLRPHTLTIPKPLQPVVGKPIVQRIVEDFNASFPEQIDEVAFIIGDFGEEAEAQLLSIAEGIGAKGSIYHQDSPRGAGARYFLRQGQPDRTLHCGLCRYLIQGSLYLQHRR